MEPEPDISGLSGVRILSYILQKTLSYPSTLSRHYLPVPLVFIMRLFGVSDVPTRFGFREAAFRPPHSWLCA